MMGGIRVGFTGTRYEVGSYQLDELTRFMKTLDVMMNVEAFVHGDCVGADAAAHEIAKDLGWYIVIRPASVNSKWRAFCDSDKAYPPKDPLKRNHDIVHDTGMLIAVPSGPEVLRSGTWATIRYARKMNRLIHIIPRNLSDG